MSGPRTHIPQAAIDAQIRSSDPAASVFVSANAGSGKTHVLVQRVVRLLLAGVPPAKILCITFTKAAAANMSQRVFAKLGEWTNLDDAMLDAALRGTGIARPDARMLGQARKLFANALETPGGLKVQTIHALCTRLLQQFPFEANVPARFTVLDDRDQTEMMERARLQVLLDAARQPDGDAGHALRIAMASAADVTFRDVVNEAVLSRDKLLAWIARSGGVPAAIGELTRALGLDANDSLAAVEREIVDGPHLPRSAWPAIVDVLDGGSSTDKDQAAKLREAAHQTGTAQVDSYFGLFLKTTDQTFKARFVTNAISGPFPEVATRFEAEKHRLAILLDKRRAAVTRDRTQALLVIAEAVAGNYAREKQLRSALDYDDLIEKTLALLGRTSAGWVHYKLDRGIDHVLIDEAQDTSPQQWDIVGKLIGEFTAGGGARDVTRTVFAVGDEKQSIFSFQGAIPAEFDRRRRQLASAFREARLPFETVRLNMSFRSGAGILNTVDAVFHEPDKYESIHPAENGRPLHEALSDAAPCTVDLWDLEPPPARKPPEGWQAPLDAVSSISPEAKLADRVQREIASLIGRGELTGSAGQRRPLTFGDVLVLVRRRGKAFDAIIKALKHAGIPVAGADRLKLTEHIAIIDMLALGDALLLPQDDLALAVALKSPLFGLDEDQLFALAHDRKGTLRDALRAHSADHETLRAAWTRLSEAETKARNEQPFAFYAWLLGADGGRKRILQRLGTEANDAIDEFLELAMSFERRDTASLQGFLAWLRASDTDIKRDMEITRNEVRVMTVHGAKGLEAPVVFLADTTATPVETQRLHLIHWAAGNQASDAPSLTVWAGRKADDPAVAATARTEMQRDTDDEYRRLLYVAMTRAADRLIIGGCQPGNRKDILPSSWYALVRDGLRRSGLQETLLTEAQGGPGLRFSKPDDAVEEAIFSPITAPRTAAAIPPWLFAPAPRLPQPQNVLRPSDSGDRHRPPASAATHASRRRAIQRGNLVHRLLQSLPDIAADRRKQAAQRYLVRNTGDDWTEAERATLSEQVLALMEDARFAHLFAAGSRAEVPIVGKLRRADRTEMLVSGQIDRLLIAPDHIWIVDYKTNAAPPSAIADVPPGYILQLALYREVLALIHPGRAVRAVLLWTETPEIMEIPAPILDDALTAIISL